MPMRSGLGQIYHSTFYTFACYGHHLPKIRFSISTAKGISSSKNTKSECTFRMLDICYFLVIEVSDEAKNREEHKTKQTFCQWLYLGF
jgi:hypothetical protein